MGVSIAIKAENVSVSRMLASQLGPWLASFPGLVTPLVFDCFQYANWTYWKRLKTGGIEGLGTRLDHGTAVANAECEQPQGHARPVLLSVRKQLYHPIIPGVRTLITSSMYDILHSRLLHCKLFVHAIMHVRKIYIWMHTTVSSVALQEHCMCSHCEAA